jgi:hypothetical protein
MPTTPTLALATGALMAAQAEQQSLLERVLLSAEQVCQ